MIRRRERDVGVGGDRRAGLRAGWPSTRTLPARISARARSRDAASPRSTSSVSRRTTVFQLRAADDPAARSPAAGRRGRRCRARRSRAVDAVGGQPPRCVEAVERRVGRLAGGGVLAGGLAELRSTRLRRRGCRRRSGTRGRPRARSGRSLRSARLGRARHDRAGERRREISAPVLRMCISRRPRRRSSGSRAGSGRLRDRCACPPTMPAAPAASATIATACELAAAQLVGGDRPRRAPARARAARTPRSAARRRRGSPCPRRRRRERSAGRGASCRCPSPAGRRG